MKTPEIPKDRQESSREELKDLRSSVSLSPEAMEERDQMVDIFANARNKRMDLVQAMKQEKNVPKGDLRNLEMALTA